MGLVMTAKRQYIKGNLLLIESLKEGIIIQFEGSILFCENTKYVIWNIKGMLYLLDGIGGEKQECVES